MMHFKLSLVTHYKDGFNQICSFTYSVEVSGYFLTKAFYKMVAVSDTIFWTHLSTRKQTKCSFSTSVHSHRLRFMRCDEMLDIIRNLDISDNVIRSSGITNSLDEYSMNVPMFALTTKLLERTSQIPQTCKAKKIVSEFFHGFLSTAVAPDRFLTLFDNVTVNYSIQQSFNRKQADSHSASNFRCCRG